jgi:hypothetical protein
VARDDEASAPSAGYPSAAPLSSLTMSAPVGGSGAGAGRLTHWSQPGGGTSSSGISTTAAWLLSIGTGAGGTDRDDRRGHGRRRGSRRCCGSPAVAALRGPSLTIAAVLPAARGAFDERRLVGTAASDLNTLAGARGGGTVGATLRTRRRENQAPTPRRYNIWGNSHLPQGGEASLPLPWGLSGRRGCGRRCRRGTPSCLHGACQRLRGVRHLSRRLPGGRRSRARPRHCFFCRLRGSGRGGRRLPPLGESSFPITLLLLV